MNQELTPPVAIRLTDVKKHFKDRDVEALGGINLEVVRGEFITLIGPSGSGKSTFWNFWGILEMKGARQRERS